MSKESKKGGNSVFSRCLMVVAFIVVFFAILTVWNPAIGPYVHANLLTADSQQFWYLEKYDTFIKARADIIPKFIVNYELPAGLLVKRGFSDIFEVAWNDNTGITTAYLMDEYILIVLPELERGKLAHEPLLLPIQAPKEEREIEIDSFMRWDFPDGFIQYSWIWKPGKEDPRRGEGRLMKTTYV